MGAYGRMAGFYDKMMADVPYEEWGEYILRIWKKLGFFPKNVLDLACGTGSASAVFANRGFEVTGVDISEEMLEVARKKTKKADFLFGDMRKLGIDKKFDAVVCLYDSLNYLLRESEIEETFREVYKVLKKKGVFVFDVNTIHKIVRIWGNTTKCVEFDGMHVCWDNNTDNETNINTLVLDFFVKAGGGDYERFKEVHSERGYSIEFLRSALGKAGFRVKGVWDAFTFNPPAEKSERVYFAAVK